MILMPVGLAMRCGLGQSALRGGISAVHSGRILFWMLNPARCAGLISGVPLGQVRTKFHESEVRKIILGWTIGAIDV